MFWLIIVVAVIVVICIVYERAKKQESEQKFRSQQRIQDAEARKIRERFSHPTETDQAEKADRESDQANASATSTPAREEQSPKRKISWQSGVLDEIELVYDKASGNESIGKLLAQLEENALSEAKQHCGLLKTDQGGHLAPEQFDGLSARDKETVIKVLAGYGLSAINQDISSATIRINLSAVIQDVVACTMFDILNRLEKLDGAITILHPKWTLELQVPLGGKKGLFQWEMLIMQLYPWLSVREVSSNEAASTLPDGNNNKVIL